MNLLLLRTAKVAALPIVAAVIVLLAEILFFMGASTSADLPWDRLVPADLGTVRGSVEIGDPEILSLWPVERDGGTSAIVAVGSAPGYRSRIDVAVTVASDGKVLSRHVVAHSESAYVSRALSRGGADALSGATLTEDGIRSATEAAVSAARDYIEEQR